VKINFVKMSQEVDEAIVTKVDEAETDGTGNLF
jgi:hypothetical protein